MSLSVFFTLKIDSASDAFQSDPMNEIGRILDATARAVQTKTEGKLYDLNGNACGSWMVDVDRDADDQIDSAPDHDGRGDDDDRYSEGD